MYTMAAFREQFLGFLDSNAFLALVTLVVGYAALFTYLKQKTDTKKAAASILLLELKNAETHLLRARESLIIKGVLDGDVFAQGAPSWEKNKYLFVNDFTSREWDDITSFCEQCELYDKAVRYDGSYFEKNEEQIRINLYKALTDYTQSYLASMSHIIESNKGNRNAIDEALVAAHRDYKEVVNQFAENFLEVITAQGSRIFYQPKKPLEDAKGIISTMRLDLSTSSVGAKLDKIANQTFRTRLAARLVGRKL